MGLEAVMVLPSVHVGWLIFFLSKGEDYVYDGVEKDKKEKRESSVHECGFVCAGVTGARKGPLE